MREAADQEELDAYPEHDEPVVRCPECGDDDRHEPDCSRNYRNRKGRRVRTVTKYDALFLPYVGLIIAEDEAGVLTVAGADCDWSDTFTNLWRNNAEGHNEEAVIEDHESSKATGRAAELMDFATSILDVIIAKDQSGASALRFIADQIDRGKKPEEMDDRTYLELYAGLAANVSSIVHDRENLDKTQEEIDAIVRANLDAVYDIVGRDIDTIEELIEKGEWTA